MKNLNNYITEKLIVNNTIQNNTYNSVYKNKKDLKNIKIPWTLSTRFNATTYTELKTVFDKMKEYKKKNKNVNTLCSNTVKS